MILAYLILTSKIKPLYITRIKDAHSVFITQFTTDSNDFLIFSVSHFQKQELIINHQVKTSGNHDLTAPMRNLVLEVQMHFQRSW